MTKDLSHPFKMTGDVSLSLNMTKDLSHPFKMTGDVSLSLNMTKDLSHSFKMTGDVSAGLNMTNGSFTFVQDDKLPFYSASGRFTFW